jgi:Domain of unknown function (DUF4304)
VATAQETYRRMLKTQLAPGLRELGFKGSGRSYELPCPDHWAMLGLQGSKWNDSSEVLFTINLLVVSRSVWERERAQDSYLGAKPKPNYMYGTFAWWERIGSLMPEREDKWWTVNAGMDTEDLSREVLLAVESYGLPAMRAQLRN